MSERLVFALKAGVAVVLFDLVASLLARGFGIPYTSFRYGSTAIYVVAGFLAARRFGFVAAPLVGAIVGLIEATLGWAVSWAIGPGRPPAAQLRPGAILFAVIFVAVLAAVCGAIGGLGGALLPGHRR